jgi:hypothetical protein
MPHHGPDICRATKGITNATMVSNSSMAFKVIVVTM